MLKSASSPADGPSRKCGNKETALCLHCSPEQCYKLKEKYKIDILFLSNKTLVIVHIFKQYAWQKAISSKFAVVAGVSTLINPIKSRAELVTLTPTSDSSLWFPHSVKMLVMNSAFL